MSQQKMNSAMNTVGGLSRGTGGRSTTYPDEEDPGKTLGGAIAAGAGGASAGAIIGSYSANPYGVAIGAAVGFIGGAASYYLS